MDDLRERIAQAIEAKADRLPPDTVYSYAVLCAYRRGIEVAAQIARETPGKRTWAEFWAMGRHAS